VRKVSDNRRISVDCVNRLSALCVAAGVADSVVGDCVGLVGWSERSLPECWTGELSIL